MKQMFLLVFLAIIIGGLAYSAWHVWCVLPLGKLIKGCIIAIFILAFLLIFVNFTGTLDKLPLNFATIVYEIGNSMIFILLYTVMVFLVLDLGRLVHLVPKSWLYQNGWTSLAVTLFLVAIFVYGNIHYYNKVRQPLDLQTEKPLSKDLRIVMMSDLHIGYHNRRAELAKWIDRINAEKPDLILIAGDIIDISVRPLLEENMAEEFLRLNAPVFACLGNHEYYSGEPKAQRFYDDAGIHSLRDTSVVFNNDIVIVGRDDRTNRHRRNLQTIAKHIDKTKYTILLDHQPYHLEQAERAGVDFQFSGHTHHGQVWPVSWITEHIYEKAFGSHQRGNTHYYITSGIGIWGGKFRIGTRSEYVVATLHNQR